MLGHTRWRPDHNQRKAAGEICKLRASLQRLSLCHPKLAGARLYALPRLHQSDYLQGVCTHVYWDLDNIRPPDLCRDLTAAVKELKALLEDGLGASVQQVALYANGETCRQLGSGLKARLTAAGITIHEVATRNQAADMQLTTDAFLFVQQVRSSHQQQQEQQQAFHFAGCLVCVSNDAGFAPLLQYAGGAGLAAIAVMSVQSPKYMPGLLPDLRRHSSAQHCCMVLSWRPQPALARAVAAAAAIRDPPSSSQQLHSTAAAEVGGGQQDMACGMSQPPALSTVVISSPGVIDDDPTSTSGTCSVRTALTGSNAWYALPEAPPAVFIEALWLNPSKQSTTESASSV